MNQATEVIRTLEDSNNKSIECQNRSWLYSNVEKLHIHVCVEDCVANTFYIVETWTNEGTILIQEGRNIQLKADFQPEKEALLIVKSEDSYMVFLYSPKD